MIEIGIFQISDRMHRLVLFFRGRMRQAGEVGDLLSPAPACIRENLLSSPRFVLGNIGLIIEQQP